MTKGEEVEGELGHMVIESVIEVHLLTLADKVDRVLAVRHLEIAATTVGLKAVATIAWSVSLLLAPKDGAVQTVTVPTTVEGEIGVDEITGAVPEALNIAEELGDVLAVHLEVGTMIMITVEGIVLEKEVQITLTPLVSNRIARTEDTAAIKTVLFFPFLLLKLLLKEKINWFVTFYSFLLLEVIGLTDESAQNINLITGGFAMTWRTHYYAPLLSLSGISAGMLSVCTKSHPFGFSA